MPVENEDVEALTDDVRILTGEIRTLVQAISDTDRGSVQRVVYRVEGMGAWGAAAVCACFLTYLSLLLFAGWTYFQVNNLWAWKDAHAGKIARLEAAKDK